MSPEDVMSMTTDVVDEPIIFLDALPGSSELGEGLEDPFVYNEDDPNLVETFMGHEEGRKALEKIATTVVEDFQQDWDGSEGYRKQQEADLRILSGDLPEKNFPFQGCANAHVPIMRENLDRLQCRVESEVFGDWSSVASVIPVGPGDEDTAEILTQHMTWQIREQIPDFVRQCKRAVLMFLMGDVICHSYWDAEKRLNVHEMLTADSFAMPFTFVSTAPDLSDVPHYTKVIRYYRHQLQAQRDRWYGVDEVLKKSPASWGEDPEMPIRETMADVQGETIPTDLSKKAPHVLLQYEGWLELPNQDRDRWCQVILDKATKRVLSLTVHEEVNWQDRIRFEQQVTEMAIYRDAKMAHSDAITQVEAQASLVGELGNGLGPEQTDALVQNLQAQIPPPPPPPTWLSDPEDLKAEPEPPRKDPILLFAHAVCWEPLAGAYGLGPGRVLADYNRAANTALCQFIDAGTLANCSTLLVSDTVDFDRPFSFSPGRINKVSGVSGAELKDSIMPLKTEPANAQLLQLVELMGSYGQAAAQSPEVLSGSPGKSGETYRGIATRIDQATKNLTVIGRAIAGFLKQVLQNNAKLNSVFLRDEEIFNVTHGTLQYMAPMKVGREMYLRDYRVRIVSDLQFQGDQERISEADQILQMSTAFPVLQQNLAFQHKAMSRCLEARHQRLMIPLLGPAPSMPTTPFGLPPPPPPGMPPPGAPGAGGPPAPGGSPHPGVPGNNPQGTGGPAPGAPPEAPAPPQAQAA